MTVTDPETTELADQEALRLRRLELRAVADSIMAAMRDMPMPKTWLDAGRTLRALAAADRTVIQLYLAPRRARARSTKPQSQSRVANATTRESPGSAAELEANPRHAVANYTVPAAETVTPHTIGSRPSKGARGHLNRSASAFATVMPDGMAPMPAQGKGTLPFAMSPLPPFRPGEPQAP